MSLASAGLAGCASLSADECQQADWRLIGFNDGSVGRPVSRLSEHRKACSKVGVVPEMDTYLAGHREGALRYCTAANGYALGAQGGLDAGVCQDHDGNGFAAALAAGRQLHAVRVPVARLTAELNEHDKRLGEIDADIEHLRRDIVDRGYTASARSGYLGEIDALQAEASEIVSRMDQLRYDLAGAEADLDRVVAEHVALGYPAQ